jgi:hypothetical protein
MNEVSDTTELRRRLARRAMRDLRIGQTERLLRWRLLSFARGQVAPLSEMAAGIARHGFEDVARLVVELDVALLAAGIRLQREED